MAENEDIGKIVAELILNDKQFTTAMRSAMSQSDKFEKDSQKGFTKVDKAFSSLGGSFIKQAAAMGAAYMSFNAIISAGKNIEDTFMRMETSWADIATLGPEAKASISMVKAEIGNLSAETHRLPTDLLSGYYQAVSAGAPAGAKALDLVRVAGISAAATLSSTATNVDVLTSYMNAFGPEAISSAAAADMFAVAVQRGKIRMEEIASEIGEAFPAAKRLGIELQDLTAFLEVMTNSGFSAAESTTVLKRLLLSFIDMAPDFKAAGTDIFKVLSTEGIAGGLREINNLSGESIEKLKQLIPNTNALMGALTMAGEKQKDFIAAQEAAVNSSGTLQKMAAEQANTQASAFTDLKSAWELFAESVGQKAKPVAEALAGVAASMLKAMTAPTKSATGGVQTTQPNWASILLWENKKTSPVPPIPAPDWIIDVKAAQAANAAKIESSKVYAALEADIYQDLFLMKREFAEGETGITKEQYEEQQAFAMDFINWEADQRDAAILASWKTRLAANQAGRKELLARMQEGNELDAQMYQEASDREYEMAQANFERTMAMKEEKSNQWALTEQAYLDNSLIARQTWQQNMDLLASQSITTFSNSAAAGLTDMAMGMKTAEQAGTALFDSLKRGVISLTAEWLVQSGIMYAKNLFFKSAETKAAAIQAAAISSVMAPTAALVSLATGGANAIGAKAGLASTLAAYYAAAIPKMHDGGVVTGQGEQLRMMEGGEQVATAKDFRELKEAIISWGNKSTTIVLRGGDALTHELIRLMAIQVQDNGVDLPASRVI